MDNPRFFFPKEERLSSKKAFAHLFKHPRTLRSGVLKFFYACDFPPDLVKARTSFAFAVPKKCFKKAVQRNLLKRRMKEIIRLNKHILLPTLEQKDSHLVILIKYEGFHLKTYQELEKTMIWLLKQVIKEVGSGELKMKNGEGTSKNRE